MSRSYQLKFVIFNWKLSRPWDLLKCIRNISSVQWCVKPTRTIKTIINSVWMLSLIEIGIKRVESSWCLFICVRADFPRLPRKAVRFALIFAVPHIPIMILRNRQPLICVSIASFFLLPVHRSVLLPAVEISPNHKASVRCSDFSFFSFLRINGLNSPCCLGCKVVPRTNCRS